MAESNFELRKFVVPEIIYGVGALDLVGQYSENLDSRKALIVTDPGIQAAGWTDAVIRSLNEKGIQNCIFADVTPNPRDYEVMAGAEVYKENECDLIIAVGGGSPMDCAKGIGIVISNDKHVLEFEGVDEVEIPAPPLICVPTTAGSSADVSQFAIILDSRRKVKIAIISKTVVPDIALIDPQTTTTLGQELTAATGMDALVHAFEAYVSNAHSCLTDIHALEAIRLIKANLLNAINDPLSIQAREPMMRGSMHAGLSFSNASLGLIHSMAHCLGGDLDLAHGLCNAILLEKVVAFNYKWAEPRYRTIAVNFGLDADTPFDMMKDELLNKLKEFRIKAGINDSLGHLGVTKDLIPKLARYSLEDPCIATNPIMPTQKQVEDLYNEAF